MRKRILSDDEIIESINIFYNSNQLQENYARISVMRRILNKPLHENIANVAEESITVACKETPKIIDLIQNKDTKEKILLLVL